MAQYDLQTLAGELANAIEITMSPIATHDQRMAAYMACEKFKETSPLCAQIGMCLVSAPNYSAMVKHFGLQLMEHQVKFNWNKITQEEKIFIKENTMKLLGSGVGPVEDKSLLHIKDALSRIVVEMVKREWPQQWTTLLSELSLTCEKGLSQTELVAMVFLRLVEDVALLQTIESNKRRKDIYQALTVNMSEIFEFFLGLIEQHVVNKAVNSEESRIVHVILATLTSFMEWVSISHIMANNGRLLAMICYLLELPEFQMAAVDCLCHITNRKGSPKDRKPLMYLFNDESMRLIALSIKNTDHMAAESSQLYLKKLTQAMSGLSSILIGVWKENDVQTPPHNFLTFLQIVLEFIRHPSPTVNHNGVLIWLQLIKHEEITKDVTFKNSIQSMIEVIGPKIIKNQFSRIRGASGSHQYKSMEMYVCLEYDSSEEFLLFMIRMRTDILEIFRRASLITPLFMFSYCEHWLNQQLVKSSHQMGVCQVTDPLYMEWEAIVSALEAVLSKIGTTTERSTIVSGLHLLEKCLLMKTKDPLIYSAILSCISSLFVFLTIGDNLQLLPHVFEKIFSAFVFSEPGDVNTSIKSKNLKRHAASLIVKIALKHPLLLLPIFEQINSTVRSLEHLSSMEKSMLQEALLIISNQFNDYERQSLFINEILSPTTKQWMDLSEVLRSPLTFIDYVGLSAMPGAIGSKDIYTHNRSNLLMALNTVLSVIKRCQCPDDNEKLFRGGFVVGETEFGVPITRNPAASHCIPLLQHILALLKILNDLWMPSSLSKIHPAYKTANQMLDSDKKVLLGVGYAIPDPMDPLYITKTKSPLDYMQTFLNSVHDSCYHLMGAIGTSLGRDLFGLEGLAQALIGSCFAGLHLVPDYRLRTIIRVFVKPFVHSCHADFYNDLVIPVFKHLTPIMLHHLTQRWEYITQLYENGSLGEDNNNDAQEVLDDILNRTLTREYIDVMKAALAGSITNLCVETPDMEQDSFEMSNTTKPTTTALQSDVISPLGKKLLSVDVTCEAMVLTIYNCIAWNDSIASLKASLLGGLVVRFLANKNLITPNLASVLLTRVLQGLQLHGQHDSNQAFLMTLGVQVYEIIRPMHPDVALSIMHQIPNINVAELQKLDDKIISSSPLGNNTNNLVAATILNTKIDKARKDSFKKITSNIVGKNIGQLFRNKVTINDLKPINNNQKKKLNSGIIELGEETGMSQLFQEVQR